MSRAITICASGTALVLAACGALLLADAPRAHAKSLQDQLEIMRSSSASADELCGKAREVADAWLVAERVSEYRMADVEAELQCNDARLARL